MLYRYLGPCLVALLFATGALAQRAADDASAHLQRTAGQYGLAADDLAELAVTDAYESRRSGTQHIYLQQYLQQTANGIPVVGAEFTVALGRSGEVVHAAGSGVALATQRLAQTAVLSASDAASALAQDAGLAPRLSRSASSPRRALAHPS